MGTAENSGFSYRVSRTAIDAVLGSYKALSNNTAQVLSGILTNGDRDHGLTLEYLSRLENANATVPLNVPSCLDNLSAMMHATETLRVICNSGVDPIEGMHPERTAFETADAIVTLLELPHKKGWGQISSIGSSTLVSAGTDTMDYSINALLRDHGEELRIVAENIIAKYATEGKTEFRWLNERLQAIAAAENGITPPAPMTWREGRG